MPLRYPCFVSYAHGGPLLSSFRDAIVKELRAELDAFFETELLWVDQEMVKALGQDLEEQLAKAICESICVIVLFVPKYSAKEWCMRELATALRVEQERLDLLAAQGLTHRGLVIPILLRGEKEDLPAPLQKKVWSDFREFSLKNSDITQDSAQYAAIRKLAEHIHQAHKCMVKVEQQASHKWCPDDGHCKLESAEITPRTQAFPNRERRPE